MTTHKVKAKTINMIFLSPIYYWIYHEFSEHSFVRRCYITASASIKILVLWVHSEVIAWYGFFKTAVTCWINMIVNNVHNNAYTSVMQRLYHLFKLINSYLTLCRIGRVRTFRNIKINRIIAPIILRGMHCLVYRAKIKHRIKMYIIYTLFYQIFNTGWIFLCSVYPCSSLCKGKIFTSFFNTNTRCSANWKVTHMNLPNNCISWFFQ